MPQVRSTLLALCVVVLLLPLAIYLKKFTEIKLPVKYNVSFDPSSCYKCKDCPCNFILDDGTEYRINSRDKNTCTLDAAKINEGVENNLSFMTIRLKPAHFVNFSNCVSWYSQHPTTISSKY